MLKYHKFFQLSALSSIFFFFIACDDTSFLNDELARQSTKSITSINYVVFPNFQEGNISIISVEDKSVIFKTKVNSDGSFLVDINSTRDKDSLILVKVDTLTLQTYTSLADLQEGITINAFTSLASLVISPEDNSIIIMDKLSSYAKKLFRSSLNGDELIDYRDLNSYNPTTTPKNSLINPNINTHMQESAYYDAILNDENLSIFITQDIDNDGLTWEDEILIGSSLTSNDTDNDGIFDKDEVLLGLDPTNKDSDFDGLLDNEELAGVTSPLLSDSDGDFFSDSYELLIGSNPLEADENANGILDGLDGDPLFKYQWHLKSNGDIVSNTSRVATIIGNDLNILDVYRYQRGDASTIIQVVDTGVELIHEDLNVDTAYSRNSINGTNDPSPTNPVSRVNKISPTEVGHGTAVAGIIAAKANNGLGLRGVVPNATIAGSNWLEEQSIEELDILWYNSLNANEILVSNNSWGTYMSKDKNFEDILRLASEQLRDGKGRIFTFASGNDREIYGNANLSYIANNRYAITVASLNHENRYSYYSNPGSNILVSAYGGSSYELAPTIATTLLTGQSYYENELGSSLGAITFDDDYARSYTFAMNGTSAATPMVSGAIALTLTSCPNLTWRDVRWLLSYTSKMIDIEDENWVKNSAGRSHNINYGYGLIDTDSMIQECRSKYYTLLTEELSAEVLKNSLNLYIPDNNVSQNITIDFVEDFVIEWVELNIDSNHPYAGDYEISLTSSSGTTTQIVAPNELRSDYYNGGFRFSSAAFMGEKSKGEWKVSITDRLSLDSGTITSVGLKIYGHGDN
ncbi:S8 family serine peptidase [Sulfurimonas sp. SAG-AH-194-L11]|nr:S8 family serine peptidase [Sulfurimonas sp. SAG-AH-194-L11]MDF1877210.1 S8 family serine peptidase [Sulfurimonas sp. SAG-AH-194-L11]